MKITKLLFIVVARYRVGRVQRRTADADPARHCGNVPAVVTASGKVLPTRWANLSFRAADRLSI